MTVRLMKSSLSHSPNESKASSLIGAANTATAPAATRNECVKRIAPNEKQGTEKNVKKSDKLKMLEERRERQPRGEKLL
jgi:hypothetical protein